MRVRVRVRVRVKARVSVRVRVRVRLRVRVRVRVRPSVRVRVRVRVYPYPEHLDGAAQLVLRDGRGTVTLEDEDAELRQRRWLAAAVKPQQALQRVQPDVVHLD